MSALIWGLVRSRTAPVHAQQAGSRTSLCELLTTHEVTASKDGAGWPSNEIEALNAARISSKTDAQIRELVQALHAKRKELRAI